jgi:FKBP-type peptidyl-prolyl cis-trans isomerase
MYYGNNLKQNLKQFGLKTIEYKEFMKGFQDLVDGKTTRMTEQQAMDTLNTAVQAAQTAMASENKKAGDAFLAENAKKPGVVTTTSGLQYQVISKGDGPKPKSTDTVNVKYEGTLLDGTVFDTTKDAKSGTDADRQIPLDQVIKGWTEGIQLMNVGSTYKFYIPAELAYGEQSPGGAIKPNSTLIFTVTLDSILPPVSTTSGSSK